MRRRDEFTLHESCDDRFGAGNELPATGFARSLSRRFIRSEYENGQCLVRFSDQGDDLRARSFEVDPSNVQQILKRRKRSNDALDQCRVTAKEALFRIHSIFEVGRKQEKLRLVQISRCQRNILFSAEQHLSRILKPEGPAPWNVRCR